MDPVNNSAFASQTSFVKSEPYRPSKSEPDSQLDQILKSASDSAMGEGQIISQARFLNLPQLIAPGISQISAGLARAAGGLVSAASFAYRIKSVYSSEKANGSANFPETRKEVFTSAASIGSGFLVGTLAGTTLPLLTGAAVVTLPATAATIVTVGAVGLSVAAVGYASYKARDLASQLYDRFI